MSETQAQAILDLRLHRLTALEQDKIIEEFDDLLDRIRGLLEILVNPDRLREVVRGELLQVKEQFADVRRTEIELHREGMDILHLIKPQDVVVTMSHHGYVKWQPLDDYSAQRRGGRGKTAATTKEEDFVERLFVANTHDTVLFFSSRGKVYWVRVYELPRAARTARGKPMVNMLPLEDGERISAILPMSEVDQDGFVLMATSFGIVKKTPCVDFSRPRSTGLIAVDLLDDDRLVGVAVTDGSRDVMLATSDGKLIRFPESDVRAMGRTARGVRGMRLGRGARVISLMIASDSLVLTATENGYGKCTPAADYRKQGRAGQGLISIRTSRRNGSVVGAELVETTDELMLITDGGKLVRTRVNEVSVLGRAPRESSSSACRRASDWSAWSGSWTIRTRSTRSRLDPAEAASSPSRSRIVTDSEARLDAIRREIDALDAELLDLLNRRARTTFRVAAVKDGETEPRYYRPEREAALLRRIAAANPGPFSDREATRLFREIVSSCRTLEQRLVIGCATVGEACAAIGHFGGAVDIRSLPDAAQALDAVGSAGCDYAMIEFSRAGLASRVMAGLRERGLSLCGEWYARTASGSSRSDANRCRRPGTTGRRSSSRPGS